jgi:hypothetical protein
LFARTMESESKIGTLSMIDLPSNEENP